MHIRLAFGNSTVSFLTDSYVPWDDKLSVFAAPGDARGSDFIYRIQLAESIFLPSGQPLKRTPFYTLYQSNGLDSRYYTFPDGKVYAACAEEGSGHFTLTYVRDFADYLKGNATLFYLSALEYQLVTRNDLILHASYIVDEGQALLFAAPSGGGKSTQAHLWEKVRGARIINGDRTLLHKEGGIWRACGWPMSGSSGISSSRTAPIKAIILLSQASSNRVKRLSPVDAADAVKRSLVIRSNKSDEVAMANTLLANILTQVPVYSYACRKDESAVHDLYSVI